MVDENTNQKTYTVKEFFEEVAPGSFVSISNLAEKFGLYVGDNNFLIPELKLFCDNESCEGFRLFEPTTREKLTMSKGQNFFIKFCCKNCGKNNKQYAIYSHLSEDRATGLLYKYGEFPEFGPPTPSKVVTILGDEKEYYFRGRRSENQGLGIGAFGYYRRVVEKQKDKIFDGIITTVKKVDPNNTELIEELENAKKEKQFTKAVETIKHGLPQTLLINGHNPLTLLHSALSEGIHEKTDEECLEFATSIRVILTDLVERLANAVKADKEIKNALNKLLQYKNKGGK